MGMCWAPGCKHYSSRETCKFFKFPKDPKMYKKWIKLLRRDNTPGPGARVCSCHFRDGLKENGPEIYEHNLEKLFQPHHLTPEKKQQKHTIHELLSEPSTSGATEKASLQTTADADIVTCIAGPSGLSQLDPSEELTVSVPETEKKEESYQPLLSPTALEAENYFLRKKLEEQEILLQTIKTKFSFNDIKSNDKLVLLYTGLPTTKIFESLCDLIKSVNITYYLKWNVVSLSTDDQLLMTLMKLRQNFPHDDLAVRFGVSQATVTNIILTFIHVIYEVLYNSLMKKIPSRQKNKSCLPSCFSTFTNCRAIIDCTEITCAVPRKSLETQRATYSTYKHKNTWKGLVAVAPNGVITFVSSLYPGATSDKRVVEACGILTQFEAGDLILADKGFLIQDLLPPGVSLNIPPFLSTPQFTTEQIRRTQIIAKARVHVERAIGRMKIYKILDYVPQSLFPYGSVIFKAVAALTNLQYPLIKEVEQLYGDDVHLDI